jgi:DNA-binding NtrC family response regulator
MPFSQVMSAGPKVLIVEDERALALALAAAVRHAGAASELAPTAAQARRKLREAGPFDAMILDIGLPDQSGLDFLRALPENGRLPTLVVTAHGGIENAITARKLGVREFFTKPLEFVAFTGILSALLKESPRAPAATGPEAGVGAGAGAAFIGAAPAMRRVFQQIAHACASVEPVLIRGGTGTGKTRVARIIRDHSLRGTGPGEDIAAGPGLTSGELIDAIHRSKGGALIIEGIAALRPAEQDELVRRIEEADADFPRIIATCGPDLHEAVTRGDFRSELYYRLQVLEVRLPALRERVGDLPVLTDYFAGQLAPARMIETSSAALRRLESHDWPGNLRELRNVVSYALTAGAGGSRIDVTHLPAYLGSDPGWGADQVDQLPDELSRELSRWVGARMSGNPPPTYRDLSEVLEAELLRELLRRHDGKLARLASEMKANRATLRRKLREG